MKFTPEQIVEVERAIAIAIKVYGDTLFVLTQKDGHKAMTPQRARELHVKVSKIGAQKLIHILENPKPINQENQKTNNESETQDGNNNTEVPSFLSNRIQT